MNDFSFTSYQLKLMSYPLDGCRAIMRNVREKYPEYTLHLKKHPYQRGYLLIAKGLHIEMVEVLPEIGYCLYTRNTDKGVLLEEVMSVFSIKKILTGPVSRMQWDILDNYQLVEDLLF